MTIALQRGHTTTELMLALPEQPVRMRMQTAMQTAMQTYKLRSIKILSQKSELFVGYFFGEKRLEHDHLLVQALGALMSVY